MVTRASIFPLNRPGTWLWLRGTGVIALLLSAMVLVARSANGQQFWPHAFCYLWNPWLLRYNLVSDGLIALAYLSISFTLVYLVREAKREIPFHWMFVAFGTFILACGGTHFMEVVTLFKPYYWVAVEVKVVTAVASVMTAIALPALVPKIKSMLTEAALSKSRGAELIQSEAKFRSIFEGVTVGIAVEDLDGRFLEANAELASMLGRPLEDLKRISYADVTDAETVSAEQALKDKMRRGELNRYELDKYISKSDGSRFPVHVTVTALGPNLMGERYAIAIIEDISERVAQQETEKRAAAVQASERRTREISEALPALIWTCSADGQVDYLNERWSQYTGRAVAELTNGDGWLDTLHPDDRDRVAAVWEQARVSGNIYEAEYRICRSDGEYRWFFARGLPLNDEAGQVSRWLGACVEVHEQRVMHDVLRRTERLAATGQLAATIAHEINNPLEAITNIVFLLQSDNNIPSHLMPLIADAGRELDRVSHIVKHSLAFYRDTAQPSPLQIGDLMRETVDLYTGRMAARGIEIKAEYESDVEITGYPGELRQVFSNILVNAIDAAGDGGKIRVRVRRAQDPRTDAPGVRVTISDNGPGIAPEIRPRLFEAFATTKGEKGTGLGLWVSRGIVAKHMGSISLVSSASAEARGTSFSIFLPTHAQIELASRVAAGQSAFQG